ncbi:MAG TPA: class I SAM-dependent methyltransferase [Bryobacteraceae bacterium]|nr:class I SAM-dependent methyltransferase [Bryobacteraceae bacterium]
MRQGIPSRTARGVAIRRAAHQLLDHPRVFEDPLALAILGEETARVLEADPARFENSPRLRAFVAARSRFAEEELAAAFHRGVPQVVVLGAGLDTFAYRNPFAASGLRVFEVDHPATQAWKRELLAEAGVAAPPSLSFVPLDFEERALAEALEEAGFRTDQPAFFSWLGVVPYLTLDAAKATLAWIGSLPAGSGVVFDYAISPASLGESQKAAFDALANRVARAGEPFQLFFEPDELGATLTGLGFHEIEDLDAAAIDRRYFSNRPDGLRVGGLAHLVSARV